MPSRFDRPRRAQGLRRSGASSVPTRRDPRVDSQYRGTRQSALLGLRLKVAKARSKVLLRQLPETSVPKSCFRWACPSRPRPTLGKLRIRLPKGRLIGNDEPPAKSSSNCRKKATLPGLRQSVGKFCGFPCGARSDVGLGSVQVVGSTDSASIIRESGTGPRAMAGQ